MRKRLGRELHTTEKADKYLFPAISIATYTALAISIWDLVVVQHIQYTLGWLNATGIVLFVSGLIIYLSARLTLGRLFSKRLNLAEGHELVTHGVYKHVRHPSYTGSILFWPGLALMLNSVPGFVVMLFLVALVLVRIPFEEKMLERAFGQQYVDYRKRTKKLIPFLY